MKKIVLSLVCVGLFSSLSAEDMGMVAASVDIAKTKIKEDAVVTKGEQVKISNSKISTESEMGNDNVVVGIDGSVVAKGKQVEISNSKVSAESEMGNDNVVVGIDGSVVAKGEQVEISNSKISTESKMGNDNVVVGVSGSVVLGAN